MSEWRDVPGYEGHYRVSKDGFVLSLRRVTQRGDMLYTIPERVLRHHRNAKGHPIVNLYRDHVMFKVRVATLVAQAFERRA